MIDLIEKDVLSFDYDEKFLEFNKKLLNVRDDSYNKDDVVLGIRIPFLRKKANKYYKVMTKDDILYFLRSDVHEMRMFALLVLLKKDVKFAYDVYIKNMKYVNNWDLVDVSCYNIVGKYLYLNFEKEEIYDKLIKLYSSKLVFVRRIAIVSCWYFIKQGMVDFVLNFFKNVINDEFYLNHKALGWMIRECGKVDIEKVINFLSKYKVSSITFSYATEHMDKSLRENLMKLNKNL